MFIESSYYIHLFIFTETYACIQIIIWTIFYNITFPIATPKNF